MTVILLLASCAPAAGPVVAEALPTVTSTPLVIATQTSSPTVVPPSPIPSPSPTATPIPCDPFAADFCITEGHFLFQNPILPPGSVSVDPTYRFGSTQNGTRDPHHGVEFQGNFGTPVNAAADGVVIFAGPDRETSYNPFRPYYDFYGNLVVIEHADRIYTLYAHLSVIKVESGDVIVTGEQIGAIGQSGGATGSHLHFEVRRGDAEDYFSAVNPELWLLPSQADLGTIALSIFNGRSEFQQAMITIQRVDEANNPIAAYYVDTYHPSLALGEENAALGDLPAGRYRVTLISNGGFYERWVEVQSGKLTQVVIVVK